MALTRRPPLAARRSQLPVRRLTLCLTAGGFAGVDRDFDAAILLPAGVGLVRGHWLALAEAARRDPRPLHALGREVGRRRRGAALGETLVVGVRAAVVSVADDHEVRV